MEEETMAVNGAIASRTWYYTVFRTDFSRIHRGDGFRSFLTGPIELSLLAPVRAGASQKCFAA
jgi:hypothetical protein